jgi:predicted DNA-binding protein
VDATQTVTEDEVRADDTTTLITFSGPASIKRRIAAVNKRTGWSASLICREALSKWLDEYEEAGSLLEIRQQGGR